MRPRPFLLLLADVMSGHEVESIFNKVIE